MNAFLALIAALLMATPAVAAAEMPATSEYEIKAAFLYNFTKFVEWPHEAFRDARAPIVIGVLGTDPFGPALDAAVAGRTVEGHPVAVRRLKDTADLAGCHVLFVSASERAAFGRVAAALAHRRVLTVGDVDGFTDAGGIIEFVVQDETVRFRINVDAAEDAGLKMSSQLLSLAQITTRGSGDVHR